uniref:Uncharacterized protein n=1 Tax=Anguilla anguilla TaxID=7936 RepID=A0A0E9VXF0_ANGAN
MKFLTQSSRAPLPHAVSSAFQANSGTGMRQPSDAEHGVSLQAGAYWWLHWRNRCQKRLRLVHPSITGRVFFLVTRSCA